MNHEKKYIYILKGTSVISIVTAHCSGISQSGTANQIVSLFLRSIGSIGVGVFFLISGYLFRHAKGSLLTFLGKKVRTLYIPWIFCATLVWLYIVLRKGNISISNWIMFVFTNGYLYYMTVLNILYLAFFYVRSERILALASVLSSASILMHSLKILPVTSMTYLNPVNWMVFFCLGMLLKNEYFFDKCLKIFRKQVLYIPLFFMLLLIHILMLKIPLGYWSPISLISQPLSILCMSYLCFKWMDAPFVSRSLLYLGQKSFSIYLLHVPFAGAVTSLCKQYLDYAAVTFFRPVIVILLTILLIESVLWIEDKTGIRYGSILIGNRREVVTGESSQRKLHF